jgi:hypothetical protein
LGEIPNAESDLASTFLRLAAITGVESEAD